MQWVGKVTASSSPFSRYIQNVVSACIPENLDLKWEFVNSYFPKQENMFMLEPTNHRNYMLLTPYGVLNAMDATPKTEEEIPDPVIYLKYLAARLCCVVFDRLGSYNSETIIHEVSAEEDESVVKGAIS